jgi:hypothetical protein
LKQQRETKRAPNFRLKRAEESNEKADNEGEFNSHLDPHPTKHHTLIDNPVLIDYCEKQFIEYTPYDKSNKKRSINRRVYCLYSTSSSCCAYDVRKRKDKNYSHECQMVPKMGALEQYLVKELSESSTDGSKAFHNKKIQRRFTEFVAKTRISFGASSSEAFYDLMKEVIQATQSLPSSTPTQAIFPQMNRKQVSEQIAVDGKIAYEDLLKKFVLRQTSILIDAGTVGGKNYVTVVLLSPETHKKPALFKLKLTEGSMNHDDYAQLGADIVSKLIKRRIKPIAFVTDGLKHQVNALSYNHDQSFVNRLFNPTIEQARVIHSPCLCHLIQLILSKTAKEVSYFRNKIEMVRELATLLRKNKYKNIFGRKCPAAAEHRWFYLMRICEFIISTRSKLTRILTSQQLTELNNIPYLMIVIKPFHDLTLALESNSEHISSVFPLFTDAIYYLRIVSEHFNIFQSGLWRITIDTLIRYIIEMIFKSRYSPMFAAAFTLTKHGQYCAYNRDFFIVNKSRLFSVSEDTTTIKHNIIKIAQNILDRYVSFANESSSSSFKKVMYTREPVFEDEYSETDAEPYGDAVIDINQSPEEQNETVPPDTAGLIVFDEEITEAMITDLSEQHITHRSEIYGIIEQNNSTIDELIDSAIEQTVDMPVSGDIESSSLINNKPHDCSLNIEELQSIDWCSSMCNFIFDYATHFFQDGNKAECALSHFIDWCKMKDRKRYNLKSIYGTLKYWEMIAQTKTDEHCLGEIAEVLLQISSSEAACERIFSRMRGLLGDSRYNLSAKRIRDLVVLSTIDNADYE